MRSITNEELLIVAGGDDGEDYDFTSEYAEDSSSPNEASGSGGGGDEKKSVVQEVADTIKEVKKALPSIEGKASIDVTIKLDEVKRNSAEIKIHIEIDGSTNPSKSTPPKKK